MPTRAIFPKYLGSFFVVLHLALLLFADTIQSKPTNHYIHNNAFGFVQDLKGCHKGQNASGLHQLKQYLEKFGYLIYDHNNNLHATDDEFDDVLESAVKSYQRNFHLEVTGILDDATAKQMALPRCGFPDNVNKPFKKFSTKGNQNHHNNRKLIQSVSHYAFFDGQPRWPASKTVLTYRFTSGDAPVTAATRSACARAFQKWQQVSHFTFQEVSDGSRADIEIGFHRNNHGDGERNAFDGPRGTFAHAFAPTRGWFHYDADENWSANPTRDELDLESVAVHEIGHLLGLHHEENVPEAIMYPYFDYGIIKRDLHEDDIRGIRALYGLNN